MFSSTVQLASLRWRFHTWTIEVEVAVGKTEVFDVEQTPLFFSRKYGNYKQNPNLKLLRHTNVVGQAIYFWPKELPFNCMLAQLC